MRWVLATSPAPSLTLTLTYPSQVKGGGAVPSLGTEVRLRLDSPEDLKRDVLKSDTCSVTIPLLELEMQSGTLGGVYTTVEGLLKKIHANLMDANPFACGDSISQNHSVSAPFLCLYIARIHLR